VTAWVTGTIKIDPASGLHARDCECHTCDELGFRPTELQRAAARRARVAADAERVRAELERGREGGEEETKTQRGLREQRRWTELEERKRAAWGRTSGPPPSGGYRAWLEEQKTKGTK
jgi:predicted phage gp36 major capsid-like protein